MTLATVVEMDAAGNLLCPDDRRDDMKLNDEMTGPMTDPLPSDEATRVASSGDDTTFAAESCIDLCRWCGHKHDPEDGHCDAHAHVGLGVCPCPGEGLTVAYDKINEALYVAERDCAELRGREAEVRAATLREVETWLRATASAGRDAAFEHAALNSEDIADEIAAHFNQEAE